MMIIDKRKIAVLHVFVKLNMVTIWAFLVMSLVLNTNLLSENVFLGIAISNTK